MRLLTYDRDGAPRLGLLVNDTVVDAADASSALGEAPLPDDMLAFIEEGDSALERARRILETLSSDREALSGCFRPLADTRLLAPIPQPRRNLVCVGLNYAEHASESRITSGIPEHPVYFTKPATAVVGPDEPVVHHAITQELDHEVELTVVIGRGGRDIERSQALAHVFGYTIINDVTARDLQKRHTQWFKGKSLDTFCPMGPVLVTADEIPDPQALAISLRVNGQVRQSSHTSKMIFPVAECIEVLSRAMTLLPGDVIATGTPDGVGAATGNFLKAGDRMEAEVERIGVLANKVVAP